MSNVMYILLLTNQQRTAKHVQNKIATIESQMRQAVDFAFSATCKGLQEDDPATFEKAILLKCKFWNELSPVFMERAIIKSLLTTEDILGNGSPNDSSDECSNSSVGSQQHDNDVAAATTTTAIVGYYINYLIICYYIVEVFFEMSFDHIIVSSITTSSSSLSSIPRALLRRSSLNIA